MAQVWQRRLKAPKATCGKGRAAGFLVDHANRAQAGRIHQSEDHKGQGDQESMSAIKMGMPHRRWVSTASMHSVLLLASLI